jgi:hypothetical protein
MVIKRVSFPFQENDTLSPTQSDPFGGNLMTPPALVYLGMGFIVARILLDGKQTRGFTWLQWLQYLVDAARIILLWPLVLLVEKVVSWLKSDTETGQQATHSPTNQANPIDTRIGGEQ